MAYIGLFSLTGYSEKYFKKLTGKGDIETSLDKLDKLTREEAQMASAEQLRMTHNIDDRVRGVGGRVQEVRVDVQEVRVDVQDVRVNVQEVRVDVQEVRVDVQDARGELRDVGNMVQDVDDKFDQANRSFFF